MKRHGEIPCGEFITRAQPAEKGDGNVDEPNQKKGARDRESNQQQKKRKRKKKKDKEGEKANILGARVLDSQSC